MSFFTRLFRRGDGAEGEGGAKKCAKCGAEWDSAVVFCGECGAPIEGQAAGQPEDVAAATPSVKAPPPVPSSPPSRGSRAMPQQANAAPPPY